MPLPSRDFNRLFSPFLTDILHRNHLAIPLRRKICMGTVASAKNPAFTVDPAFLSYFFRHGSDK